MSFYIDIPTVSRTSKQVIRQLERIPPALIPEVEMAIANYLLNVIIKQEIPPEKRVTRRSVYGVPFKTPKMRRWFFWALAHSLIDVPYRRRGKHGGIQTQWHIVQEDKSLTLRNDDPAAKYVYGDDTQNKLIKAIGWKVISTIVQERLKNLGGVAKRAADKALKSVIPHP